ncbi:unnamed protein product [Psylliodes chrysocephalus]|uniref:Uncharacterized protein n=1 Tax=Psylliodes chrysocephalus TaxID=3402493 RepID=A0A9P0CVN3_9CUCU|nr:unnamed protein product [Psylliodes chrysocephala]
MIKSGESSYANLLKKIKEEVDIGKIGVKINRIRKTGKRDLLLAVEGGKDRANILEREINTKIENANVTTNKTGTTTLYIIGMDLTTQESELKQVIVKETNIKEAEIDIKVIRKGKYGDQTDIIEIPRLPAAVLIRERKLKVEWIYYGVRERIHVVRCFKYLEYGHKTYECISTKNQAEEFNKCGQTGHKKPFGSRYNFVVLCMHSWLSSSQIQKKSDKTHRPYTNITNGFPLGWGIRQ